MRTITPTTSLNDQVNALFDEEAKPTTADYKRIRVAFGRMPAEEQVRYWKQLRVRSQQRPSDWQTLAHLLFECGSILHIAQYNTFSMLAHHFGRHPSELGLAEQLVYCLRELTINERR